jgi:hypothetical protein
MMAAAVKNQTQTRYERIAAMRADIAEIQSDMDAPQGMINADEAIERLKLWIGQRAKEFEEMHLWSRLCAAPAYPGPNNRDFRPFAFDSKTPTGNVDLTPLLCWLAGPTIADRAADMLRARIPEGALTSKEAAAHAAQRKARLRELEVAEELLIRESDSAGEPIPRRGDARPEIVLTEDLR